MKRGHPFRTMKAGRHKWPVKEEELLAFEGPPQNPIGRDRREKKMPLVRNPENKEFFQKGIMFIGKKRTTEAPHQRIEKFKTDNLARVHFL